MLINAVNQSYATNQINRGDINQNMIDKAKDDSEKEKTMMAKDEEKSSNATSTKAAQKPQKGSAYSPSKPNMMSKPSAVMSTVDQIV